MRALLPLLLLAGCATHDVLRSEPIAERAACSGGLGVYGYPLDVARCADEVIALGDACYAVRAQGKRQLVECAASAPDGHVMCLVDPRGDRVLFAEERFATVSTVTIAKQAFPAVTTLGRCRARYRTWVAEREPRQPAPELVVTGWSSRAGKNVPKVPDVSFVPVEDPIALDRIVPYGSATAHICPGPRIELRGELPARFAHRLREAIGRAFQGVEVRWCDDLTFWLGTRQHPPHLVESI